MGREDDLVRAELSKRVLHRLDGVRVPDLAARMQSDRAEPGDAAIEARTRRVAGSVLVRCPVPQLRVERRADDVDVGRSVLDTLADRLEELLTFDRLVCDDE